MKTLADKFLVTGLTTMNPRPCIPHPSLESAVESAKGLISNAQFAQDGAVVWAPVKIVRRKAPPVEVLDPQDFKSPAVEESGRQTRMNPSDTPHSPAVPVNRVDLHVTTRDGKYTVIQDTANGLHALRYGQPWRGRDLAGDQLVLTLAQDLAAAREELAAKDAECAADKKRFADSCRAELVETRQRAERAEAKVQVTLGIGNGSGNLYVHGDYESIAHLRNRLEVYELACQYLVAIWRNNQLPAPMPEKLCAYLSQ